MLQQDVALVEDREQVGLAGAGQCVSRLHRRIPQSVEARHVRERHQPAKIERSIDEIDVRLVQLETVAEQSLKFRGRAGLQLESNDVAAAAPPHLALDDLQVGAPAFIVQLELRVSRQADHRRLDNRLAGKEQRQVRPDELFEEDMRETVPAGDRDESRETPWHLHDREALRFIRRRRIENQRQVQAE